MTGPTDEQLALSTHPHEAFVIACPGAGKTGTIVSRIVRIAPTLLPRQGLAILSFTNSAIEEFITRCHAAGVDGALRHPGFVGTFDAFLRRFFFLPGGIDGVNVRPTVIDSWETVGVDVRLSGSMAFRGEGVPLDRFDAETNQIDPASINHNGLRAHIQANRATYERAAAQRRQGLRRNGYVSAADVRVLVSRRLQQAAWSNALGRILAHRFKEVIVDEAQDCNPLDCQIINWLRSHGIAVTILADPDQAIYAFRRGDPSEIRVIADRYDSQNRLTLTGNFRSSPPICAVAATLRSRTIPDISLGDTADVTEPVHVVAYSGHSVPPGIGRFFSNLTVGLGIRTSDAIVLAHSRRNAMRACGLGTVEEGGSSNVAGVARSVGKFWASPSSGHTRESALGAIERSILSLTGQIEFGETPGRAAERCGIDRRWLRRSALELVSRIPRTCANSDDARAAWIAALCECVERLGLTYRQGTTLRRHFQSRSGADWHNLLLGSETSEIRCTTVHEAKGKQYEAVCLVIPPEMAPYHRTEHLLSCWENRSDDEAKRVVYVAVTRAKKLVVIAVPAAFNDRLMAIFNGAQCDVRVHQLRA